MRLTNAASFSGVWGVWSIVAFVFSGYAGGYWPRQPYGTAFFCTVGNVAVTAGVTNTTLRTPGAYLPLRSFCDYPEQVASGMLGTRKAEAKHFALRRRACRRALTQITISLYAVIAKD